MKFIKFRSQNNTIHTGILEEDGTIRIVTGNIVGSCKSTGKTSHLSEIKDYLVPIDVPNIIALGLNFMDHATESQMEIPTRPVIFLKATTTLTGHRTAIALPREAPSEVDYEAELGVIIGKKAKHISPQQVKDYIFGYTCMNDVTARDCALKLDRQWARGKSFDTFGPIGPVIETELDPGNLRVRLFLNGQCLQDASTKDMMFSVPDTICFLSRNMTLLPGTLVMMGTPPGVGFARSPQVFLKPGDTVSVEIENIGRLENSVVSE
jgi:2-keto-4-pentenoate hydratase/2-oxohepta-3-ene-1,7-dioic acid hydratase in catechol pathway